MGEEHYTREEDRLCWAGVKGSGWRWAIILNRVLRKGLADLLCSWDL